MSKYRGIALLLLVACNTLADTPPGLLEREKFTEVLMGAQLIEARMNHEMVIDKRADSPVKAYYDSLFVQKGITEEEFTLTFRYYSERPKDLKAIYETVLTRLGQAQDSLQ